MLKIQQKELQVEKHLKILKKCPLFKGIEDDNLIRMLNCLGARIEFFDKKYTVFAEAKPAKYIGILLSGSAHMVQLDYYGNRSILSEIAKGEIFAESFACAGTESLPVSVIADEPCEVMLIEAEHILHICHNGCSFHHRLIYNLMKDLAEKNIAFHRRIGITSKRTTAEKLLAYLDFYSKKTGKVEFDIPFDRQELADYLEVERSGLSAEINKLQRAGIISAKKNHFTLL